MVLKVLASKTWQIKIREWDLKIWVLIQLPKARKWKSPVPRVSLTALGSSIWVPPPAIIEQWEGNFILYFLEGLFHNYCSGVRVSHTWKNHGCYIMLCVTLLKIPSLIKQPPLYTHWPGHRGFRGGSRRACSEKPIQYSTQCTWHEHILQENKTKKCLCRNILLSVSRREPWNSEHLSNLLKVTNQVFKMGERRIWGFDRNSLTPLMVCVLSTKPLFPHCPSHRNFPLLLFDSLYHFCRASLHQKVYWAFLLGLHITFWKQAELSEARWGSSRTQGK